MTVEKEHLFPAPGLKLRHQSTKELIGEEGASVPMDAITFRRLRDGELLREDPKAPRPTHVREAFPDTRGAQFTSEAPPTEAPSEEQPEGDEPGKDD